VSGPRLAGKVAIVTGAGSRGEGIGNGRAAAVLFAREGAKVLLVDQTQKAAEETLEMIRGEKGEAEIFEADVTRSADCEAMVADAVRRWGRLDILDNNVGIGGRATVVEVDEAEWDHLMKVNVTSMMLTS
jgi:NAD(P)-dependent dehydrogenase (short-subunit alcohol dehydrogenase family)